jgi:hypothetical protein
MDVLHAHIPKTAGTALAAVLASWYGIGATTLPMGMAYDPVLLERELRHFPWLRALSGHGLQPWSLPPSDDGPLWIVLLREPIARFVSDARHQADHWRLPNGPDDYLATLAHHDRQCRFIAGDPDAQAALQILRHPRVLVGLQHRMTETLLMLRQALGKTDRGLHAGHRANAASSRFQASIDQWQQERAKEIAAANVADTELLAAAESELFEEQLEQFDRSRMEEELTRVESESRAPSSLQLRLQRGLVLQQRRFLVDPYITARRTARGLPYGPREPGRNGLRAKLTRAPGQWIGRADLSD